MITNSKENTDSKIKEEKNLPDIQYQKKEKEKTEQQQKDQQQ